MTRSSCFNSELDDGRFFGFLAGFEELPDLESSEGGDDVRWDLLHPVVVGENGVVVDLTTDRDLVLRVGQVLLERLEVLRCAQFRIGLGDGEQLTKRLGEEVLSLGLLPLASAQPGLPDGPR